MISLCPSQTKKSFLNLKFLPCFLNKAQKIFRYSQGHLNFAHSHSVVEYGSSTLFFLPSTILAFSPIPISFQATHIISHILVHQCFFCSSVSFLSFDLALPKAHLLVTIRQVSMKTCFILSLLLLSIRLPGCINVG